MQRFTQNAKDLFTSLHSKLSGDEISLSYSEPTLASMGTCIEGLRMRIMLLLEKTQDETTLLSVLRTLENACGCGSETVSSMTDPQGMDTGLSFSQLGAKSFDCSPASFDRIVGERGKDSSFLSEKREESDHEQDSDAHPLFAPDDITPCGQQLIHSRRGAVSAESLTLSAIQTYTSSVVQKNPEEEVIVRESIIACLLFSNMDSSGRETLVKAMKKERFSTGSTILRQGTPSKEKLFLITEGMCEVIKNGRQVDTLHVGSFFGEMELMYPKPLCTASIRGVTNCTVYTLSQDAYQHIALAASLKKRKKYEDLLSNVVFLSELPRYDRMCIAEALTTKTYKKNDYIIRFGERGNWMHIIVEGEVRVVGRHMGKKCNILSLKEGNVVGELDFVFKHLAVADVVAVSPYVVTARIHRKHLELITGSILDNIKEHIANNEVYSRYLGEANERIKDELDQLNKRSKRIAGKADKDSVLLDNVDPRGEIIIPMSPERNIDTTTSLTGVENPIVVTRQSETSEKNEPKAPGTEGMTVAAASKRVLFRFPLIPLHTKSLAMIGLHEDGSILMWNDMMTQFTGYTAEQAIGQHIFSFLTGTQDQRNMQKAIDIARHYTGDVETFMEEKDMGSWICYKFFCLDGLTKVRLKLTVLPSIISHGRDGAEMVLAVGDTIRLNSQKDLKTQVLVDQITGILRNSEFTYEDRFYRIAAVLSTFDWTYRAVTAPTENMCAVDIRQMIGQVIMEYGVQCVDNSVAVRQRFEGLYTDIARVNANSLLECLRYAMHNCSKHLDDAQVTVTVTITENNGFEFLVIVFHDDGPGFPFDLLSDFHQGCASKKYPRVSRVRAAMEKQGGSMFINSVPGDTLVTFVVPFFPDPDDTATEETVQERLPGGFIESCSTCFGVQASPSTMTAPTASSAEGLPLPPPPPPKAQHTFTTLLVEDVPVHRNMLCSFLWDQKHTVLPAYNTFDIEHLMGVIDILFIDPHQSIFADRAADVDPITLLLGKVRRMAVVITGSDIDEDTAKAYHTAGFLTLKKPFTSLQALHCIRLAEETIAQHKLEAERVMQARETLSKNIRGAWTRGKLLGKGAFGEVYEATEILTGCQMAVKEIRLGKHNLKMEQFVNEILTMCSLQHPNIIHYFYCEEDKEKGVVRVFMEYAAGGNLQQLLQRKGALSLKELQSLLHDIVEGVAYIHSMGHVHCDLKTANILLSSDGKGKIGDFGTARTVSCGELLYQMQGSPLYMSPECMSAGDKDEDGVMIGYSFPSDIWSLGCIALEMATNSPPFSHLKDIKGPMGLMKYITSLHDTPDLSPLFDGPPSVVEFVSACLNPDPLKRATADDLRKLTTFSEAPEEHMKSALIALKRAQLLHVFNSFVAFQETDDAEHHRPHNFTAHGRQQRCNSDSFYSSSSSNTSVVQILTLLPNVTAEVNKGDTDMSDETDAIGECFENTRPTCRAQRKEQSLSVTKPCASSTVDDGGVVAFSRCSLVASPAAVVPSTVTDANREKFLLSFVSPLPTPPVDFRSSFAMPNFSIHFMDASVDTVSAGAHECRGSAESRTTSVSPHAPLLLDAPYPQEKELQALQLEKNLRRKRLSPSLGSMLRRPMSSSKSSSFVPQPHKRKTKMMFCIESREFSLRSKSPDASRPPQNFLNSSSRLVPPFRLPGIFPTPHES